MKLISILFVFFSLPAMAHNALVYGGPGACEDGCVDAAVEITRLAGLDPLVVTHETFDPEQLKSAKVWVQPGGQSSEAAKAMGFTMMEEIKAFIANGGGYVGFCAGAFLTTNIIGTTQNRGLGIIPGHTIMFANSPVHISIQPMLKDGVKRFMYWEEGPYFSLTADELKQVKVTWKYINGDLISGIDTTYGKGRVSVTGVHPEAPEWWSVSSDVIDEDGLDHDIAAGMVKWAANI